MVSLESRRKCAKEAESIMWASANDRQGLQNWAVMFKAQLPYHSLFNSGQPLSISFLIFKRNFSAYFLGANIEIP